MSNSNEIFLVGIMNRKLNLASTDEISKAQLDNIVKEVAVVAKRKADLARKKFDKKIDQEIRNAKKIL
jgi:predicted Zn-dependent protease